MNYRGRIIDPFALWREYCPEIDEEDGPFLNLTYCPNPNHDNTRSPAFQINVHEPMVHCFSHCGISGSYEHAICVIEGLYEKFNIDPDAPTKERGKAYREARRRILRSAQRLRKSEISSGKRSNASRRRKPEKVANDKDKERLDDLSRFSYLPAVAVEYLDKRGISSSIVSKFSVGWDAAEGRIVLPVFDSRSRCVGLIRRAVRPQDHPKYLYTEGFDRNTLLFGTGQLDLGLVKSEGLILVEGSVDALHMHSVGFANTAAILGSNVSERHAEIIASLRPARIYLMFDKDPAGIWAIMSAKKLLRKFPLFVCRYPQEKSDPADLTKKEAHTVISRALPWLKFARRLPESMQGKGVRVGKD